MKSLVDLNEDQSGCLKAVQRINNEQHDRVGWRSHNNLLAMSICSYAFVVKLHVGMLAEITLYDSSQDEDYGGRIYYEKSDKYEEWYSFLKRKFREVKNDLNNIKL